MGYRKSRYSANTNCFEVNMDTGDGTVKVRDSKNPNGATLTYTAQQWQDFIQAIKESKSEVPGLTVRESDEEYPVVLHNPSLGADRLEFTKGELDAFIKGVRAGEFNK